MMMQSLNIDGMKVAYCHSGKGQNLVLLHGIPTNSSLWEETFSYLGKNYSVYAFDLLGFGESDRLGPSAINISSQANFFMDVFKVLGIENPVIIGHDIGGGIAQIIAVSKPELLKAMVLIDSVCYDSWPIELLSMESKLGILFEHLPEEIIYEIFSRYITCGLYNKDKAAKVMSKYWKYINSEKGVQDFLDAVESFDSKYTMDVMPMLKNIRIPVLILWGKHDSYLKLSYGYRLSEDIRNSEIEVIEGGGHFLPEDQPEKVAESIDSFIRRKAL